MQIFQDIYNYRELLKSNIKKDIRGKYKGSFLGILWSFLNPLLQVLVYYIVFPYLMRGASIPNYIVYLVTGIIPWTFFSTVITSGTKAIIMNEGIVKKVYFPREILVISQVISGLINFFISCIIVLFFCLIFKVGISIHVIIVPIIALIQSILSLGIVFILSSVEVYIQDLEYIVTFIINMLFYGTQILYPVTLFPEGLRFLLYLNPFTHIVTAYRDIFMYHTLPNIYSLLYVLIIAIICFVLGMVIFRKLEKGFAEEI